MKKQSTSACKPEPEDMYGAVASVYDRLNRSVDYRAWADFYEECFSHFCARRPSLVLDLGCGTGRMTYELLSRGYDMIGIDSSVDMLSEAAALREDPSNPLLLRQDMRELELYGGVDAVVSTLDCVNYLTGDGDMLLCFKRVFEHLCDGGVFVFDVNTPYKFENTFGERAYILGDDEMCDEDDTPRGEDNRPRGEDNRPRGEDNRLRGGDYTVDGRLAASSVGSMTSSGGATMDEPRIFCAWQNRYDPGTRLCEFYLTIFKERKNGFYSRAEEWQTERCFSLDEIRAALKSSGFELCGVFGGLDFSSPADNCERWHIVARRSARR